MARFRFPFPRAAEIQRDIDDELEFHLAETMAELERQGLSSTEARAEARARLGDVADLHRALYRLDHRSVARHRMRTAFAELRSDLVFAARRIRRRPTLTVAIVLTLAIGLGTSLTFAGAADAILLRPLPLHEPDRAVTLWRSPDGALDERTGLAPGTAMDLVESMRSLSALAVAQPFGVDIERDGEPLDIGTWRVTDGYFAVLRAVPVSGRLLESADFAPGAEATVVVSHGFWQRHLDGIPDAVGRWERLDGIPHQIVGVLPADFPLSEGRQLYVPYRIAGNFRENRVADYWSAFARLAPGASLEAARSELAGLAERSDARGPATERRRVIQVLPLADTVLGDMRGRLGLLALAAFLLLLMAAANASGLMIADTMGRQRELAVRASVGAGRERIIRQLLTESVLLALGAGTIGVVLGAWGLRLFRAWAPPSVPRLAELQPDIRLVAIAIVLTTVLAAIVGAASARIASTTDLSSALKNSGDAAGGTRGRRFRAVLVATQVALAVLLLSSGGLLLRSWIALSASDQGYLATGVLGIESHIWGTYRTPESQAEFATQLTDRLSAVPGVIAAAVATDLPLAPAIGGDIAETRPVGASETTQLHGLTVSPGYFTALAIDLVEGRLFSADDRPATEPVTILSRSAARRLFADGNALDAYVELSAPGVPPSRRRVVGIVADARYTSLEAAPDASLYVPHAQLPTGSLYFVTRHEGDAAQALGQVRAAIREVMPGGALNEVVSLDEIQRKAATPRRFALLLLLSFAGVALALTGVGLFGLLAQVVRLRERELGIRLALGAWPAQLRLLLFREGLRLAATGFAFGTITFLGMSGALRGLLYGVPARDPLTILGVATLMLVVTAVSCWWPATLATRVDPLRALNAG